MPDLRLFDTPGPFFEPVGAQSSPDLSEHVERNLGRLAKIQPGAVWAQVVPIAGYQAVPDHGWKIHLSFQVKEWDIAVGRLCAIWKAAPFTFKILSSLDLMRKCHSSVWPRSAASKVVTIYPRSLGEFSRLVESLTSAMADLEGPRILTDRRAPGSKVVHYRYGAFRSDITNALQGEQVQCLVGPDGALWEDTREVGFRVPPWAVDPYRKEESIFAGNRVGAYRVISALQHSTTGGVYIAIDHQGNEVIVKEARRLTGDVYEHGTLWDARAALLWERDILERVPLAGCFPKLIDLVEAAGNTYLVMSRVGGVSLQSFLAANSPSVRGVGESVSFKDYNDQVVAIVADLREKVGMLHSAGIVHGDLSLRNVLVDPDTLSTAIIDFGSARGVADSPRRFARTLGFSPEPGSVADGPGVLFDNTSLAFVRLGMVNPRGALVRFSPVAYVRSTEWAAARQGVDISEELGLVTNCALAHIDTAPGASEASLPRELIDSLAAGIEETFDSRMDHPMFPLTPDAFDTSPLAWAHGAAGVLATLHLSQYWSESMASNFFDRLRAANDLPDGFHLGWAGVAVTAARIGDPDLALVIMRMVASRTELQRGFSIARGTSGIGLAALELGRSLDVAWLIDMAVDIAQVMISSRPWEESQIERRTDHADGVHTGVTGMAFFLSRLAELTNDDKWANTAAVSFKAGLSRVRARAGVAQRESCERPGVYEPYLSKGGAGLLLSASALARVNRDEGKEWSDLLLNGLPSETLFSGLFDGIAGIMEAAYRAGPSAQCSQVRDRIIASGLGQLAVMASPNARGDSALMPANGLIKASMDHASGAAGVLRTLMLVVDETPEVRDTILWGC